MCRSAFLHVFFVITTALARMAQAIYAALVPRAYTSSNQYSKLWLIAFVLPQLRAVPGRFVIDSRSGELRITDDERLALARGT